MRVRSKVLMASVLVAAGVPALAYVGFVTVAQREDVSVTIYNSADLTLVKDRRNVVMKKGLNALRFEWSGTLIDPTSLLAFPPSGVSVLNTRYPLDHGESLVWEMTAADQVSGLLGVQYFTSGLSWAADHMVTLTSPGKAQVETWITVRNGSGEEYSDARFRLVVGEVRLVERIRDIAQRFKQEANQFAPPPPAAPQEMMLDMEREDAAPSMRRAMAGESAGPRPVVSRPKSVERESLSELHLYSIEGTESVPSGGARRMRAFTYRDVAVHDVYRCVNPSGLVPAQRVVSFKNTKDNHMGTQPLPEGRMLLFRARKEAQSYDGTGQVPYTPMGEEAETPLGYTPGVTCEAYVKNFSRRALDKDTLGRTKGWEDVTEYELKIVNGSSEMATFEVRQNHEAPFSADLKEGRAEDTRTLQELGAFEKKVFKYAVAVRRGTLAQKAR